MKHGSNTEVQLESHPPERRRRPPTVTLMCCCSCCCCCLHTVGGIIGSALAPAFGRGNRAALTYYYDEELDIQMPDIARPGVSSVKVFWIMSLIAAVVWAFASVLIEHRNPMGGLMIGLVILALVYPAVQLGCAVVLLLWMACSSRQDRSYQLKQLGKITLGLFLGTIAGILFMVGIGVLMSIR